jgi:hypothetical protein
MRNSISVFLHAGGVSTVPVRRPGRTVCMYIYTPALGNCSMHCSISGTPDRNAASQRSAARSIPAVVRALLPTQRTKILLS